MSFVCPLCLTEGCLDQPFWAVFVCKIYDKTYTRDYLEIWNTGYRAGKGNPDIYANQETY